MNLNKISSIVLMTFLTSCATMNKEECLSANWFEIGKKDSSQGRSTSRMLEHGEACQEYGVQPNAELYNKGHQEGLNIFCTPENGLQVGRRGAHYSHGFCPSHLETGFLKKYSIGIKVHSYEMKLLSLNREISEKESLRDRAETTDAKLYYKMKYEIKSLKERRERLKFEMGVYYGSHGLVFPSHLF